MMREMLGDVMAAVLDAGKRAGIAITPGAAREFTKALMAELARRQVVLGRWTAPSEDRLREVLGKG
jgi:hypothetical protein